MCIIVYLESSKVNDAVDVGMSSKHLTQSLLVCDVHLVEGWPLATDQLNAIQGNLRGVVQAVDNYNLITMLKKG